MKYRGLKLDKFQIEAIEYLKNGYSVMLCAPTGSGKTLVAEYLIERELENGNNIIYTAPIKAINNQKFRDFAKIYQDKIGILTGDVTINPKANCLIMTTEILRNMILDKDPRLENISYIIFDEVHFMDDTERGSVWEESFIYAPQNIKFLCLSATISNIEELCKWLTQLRGKEFKYIISFERPVPLNFYSFYYKKFIPLNNFSAKTVIRSKNFISRKNKVGRSGYRKKFDVLYDLIYNLKETMKLPAIVFVFSRIKTEVLSDRLAHIDFLTMEEKMQVKQKFNQLAYKLNIDNQFTDELQRLLKRGVCYHHAGLLPSIKELIEQMFATGLIKVLFATETFALGVNFPAKSVVFTDLYKKQDGKILLLSKRNFFQMAGRAGRRGIDKIGYAFITPKNNDNLDLLTSFVNAKKIESINSRFNLTYATILNLYKDLQENIVDAYEKSFANFIANSAVGPTATSNLNATNKIKENLQNKLKVLKYLKYIDDYQLTSKGNFASKLYGHELFVSETFFANLLDNLPSEELCIIFSSLIYDSHIRYVRSYQGEKTNTILAIEKISEEIIRVEKMFNIKNSYQGLNFALEKEVRIWYKSGSLEDLYNISEIYLGDLIRHFRQIIQLCRELREVIKGFTNFEDKLSEIINNLNRSEVDAYKQLQTF